jgi:RNA polymerase sigma-70 factor (ECF subfamily)
MRKPSPKSEEPRPGTASDVDLMLGFQAGDDRCFAELVGRHQNSVLRLVGRFLGPVADADDLAQEVFVRLYQARRSYKPSARFTTFLYRNTLNLCLNYLRDRKHRRAASLDASAEDDESRPGIADPEALQPAAALAEKERTDAVRRAVDELPENQRTALVLLRWQDLSYQEIGETMDLSVMAVKSLLSRAKENLRERLSFLLRDDEAVRGAGGAEGEDRAARGGERGKGREGER